METRLRPKAIILLCQPNFKFRYKKYFLKEGDNYIGSAVDSDILLESTQHIIPKTLAIISVNNELTTLKCKSSQVSILSNMLNRKQIVKLPQGIHYIIQMEKDFYLGPFKSVVQVLSLEDLKKIKNVVNAYRFSFGSEQESQDSNKTEEIKENAQYQPTIQLEDGGYDPTIRLDDTLIEDDPKQDIKYFQKKQIQKPQPILKAAIPSHHSQDNYDDDISMPDTLQQDDLPATIQQNNERQINKQVNKMFKTLPAMIHKQEESMKKMKSWEQQKKPIQVEKNIEDFMDLFDVKDSKKTDKLSSGHQSNIEKNNLKSQIMIQNTSISIFNSITLNSLQKSIINKSSNKQQDQKQDNKLSIIKKVAFSQCKPNDIMKNQLKKKGYHIITDPKEDYDLLIVGNQLKRTPRLLIALLQGKQIKNQGWIFNPATKINGKLQGFIWDQIQKKKGKKGNIFKGRQEFSQVMSVGGATLVDELGRGRANQQLSLIIDQKDKQLFDQKKHYKKWSFYSWKMIVESVLMGQQIKQKYEMDEYSF